MQFTASAELCDKLKRVTDLMRHSNPSGDLSVVVERAVDLLTDALERQRLGKTMRSRIQTARKSTRRGYVSRRVRREVFERDGEQCTFVDGFGRRCEARAFLEVDHRTPRALGGTDDADNLSVKCRAHNALAAEHAFGRAHVEKKKADSRNRPRKRGDDEASEKNRPRQRGDDEATEKTCPCTSAGNVTTKNHHQCQRCQQSQRGNDDTKDERHLRRHEHDSARAHRALCRLGFKEREVRRALAVLDERWAGSTPPLETVVREALRVLT